MIWISFRSWFLLSLGENSKREKTFTRWPSIFELWKYFKYAFDLLIRWFIKKSGYPFRDSGAKLENEISNFNYQKDEQPSFVYFIFSGKVGFFNKLYKLFRIYIKGSYFGEIEIFKSCSRQYYVNALTETDVLLLPKDIFMAQLKNFSKEEEIMYIRAIERDIINKKTLKLIGINIFFKFIQSGKNIIDFLIFFSSLFI